MTRGGKGGNRGGNRGRATGTNAGYSGGYGGGPSPAQSGGVSHSFQGNKTGAPSAGGSRKATARKSQGTGGVAPGNRYTVVATSGDKAPVGLSGTSVGGNPLSGSPRGVTSKGKSNYDHVKPKSLGPVRGKGH